MFVDNGNYQILSDEKGQYIDCKKGGEDLVQININSDGSLNWAEFYPGRMYYHYPKYPPSTRTVIFNFGVADPGIISGYGGMPHEAIHEILRWYRDSSGNLQERNTKSPGFLNYGGLHVPIMINTKNRTSSFPFDDVIQFAIEPDVANPGSHEQAVTIPKVDAFYGGDPGPLDTSSYFCTAGSTGSEPAPYIIYQIVSDATNGDWFDVGVIARDRRGKPITWSIKPKSGVYNIKLCVGTPNFGGSWSTWGGEWIYLTEYTGGLSFELILSLNPIASGAPARYSSSSTTWGEIKGK